ncbi:MAG: hypothetical protein KDJ65_05975 [Anaerolineae bacterium]|nr:hypothetical protein [Anaerolineae bacterium]
MIGLDFPVKPEWIHDVHDLWEPHQPIGDLIQAALGQTMQELGGEKTRRNSLGIILRYFVTTEGDGNARRTAAKDVWVSYSRAYPISTMAPAYLAHLIAQNNVAQEISRFLVGRYAPGDDFSSRELRRHVSAIFGQRKVVTNAASAFLRSLEAFGVLRSGQRRAEYQFVEKLQIEQDVFPLIVWTWWQTHQSPQINTESFAEEPSLAFLQAGDLTAYWSTYQSTLWSIDERLDGHRATLKYVKVEFFQEALSQLLPNAT